MTTSRLRAALSLPIVLFLSACGEALVNYYAFYPTTGMQINPKRFTAPIEHHYLMTMDYIQVSAFYIPHPTAQRTILFLHGNAGNASHRLPDAVRFWGLNAKVLLLDYRGYGRSEGRPSEQGIYRDAEAALQYLVQTLAIPITDIVLYGRSLGSAVALDLAQNKNFAGVILVSPLSSGQAVSRSQGLSWLSPLLGKPFNSLEKIEKMQSRLLIFHGDQDEVLPVSMAKALLAKAPTKKKLVIIEGAGHNDLIEANPVLFFGEIRSFLDEVLPLDR